MKPILILLTLISLDLGAQDAISFAALHDVKLGLGMDKAHKNDAPTLDLILNMNWEGKQYTNYYFSLQTQYETANLYSGWFKRYSVNALWNLNRLVVPKLEVGMGAGLGVIHRKDTGGLLSYGCTVEARYPIVKSLYLVLKNEWVRRPDLETPKIAYNLALGLTLKNIKL